MERIAEARIAGGQLTDLANVPAFQPRLEYYIDALGHPFSSTPRINIGIYADGQAETTLSERKLTQVQMAQTMNWIDNDGLEYKIVCRMKPDLAQMSKSVHSGETYERLDQNGRHYLTASRSIVSWIRIPLSEMFTFKIY